MSFYPKMPHLTEIASQAKADGSVIREKKNRGILKWQISGFPISVLKSKIFANLSSTR